VTDAFRRVPAPEQVIQTEVERRMRVSDAFRSEALG